jgi:hypothetical protein
MAECATCRKAILMGGVKDETSDLRYCSQECRFNAFYPRLVRALASSVTAPAPPAQTAVAAPAPDREDWEKTDFPGFADDGKDLLVIVSGLGVCAAVAGLIYWLVEFFGYPFHGQTIWFVIPVGAFFCGMVAGIGFWLALRVMKRTVGKQSRSGSDPEAVAAALGPVIAALSAGRLQEALELHAAAEDRGKKGFWNTTIVVEACPGCGMHKATMTATVPGQRGPQAVEGFKYEGTSTGPVQLFL